MNETSAPLSTPPTPDTRYATTLLDPATRFLVIINTCTVKPERAEELLALLTRSTLEVLQFVPGFISANLHLSLDHTQVVNYAQWENAEAPMTTRNDPDVQARIQAASEVAEHVTQVFFELQQCFPAQPPSPPSF